ncbi:low molecular weight phosphatase family protein [Halomicroarcula sp. F13]|uniref:Low molecular weight phosphatase family protein n=1 Tax=Haloarcula rubra TaxID=2487747 RepID=A0AAW4PM95_9EURY|nr:low molecular weight phosphatase family protein [Halomicroarcula rubra]MBX0322271.1 low molecular weight phosphatase family protein [Halomicroarcula rubra]
MTETFRVAFVCVQNAGRSQMSTAFAEREVAERGLGDHVEIVTGGTDPADRVHPEVVETMRELDVDLSERTPRHVSTEELDACDLVVTMGCSTLSLSTDVEVRDWALDDPDGRDAEAVRAIRDEVRHRVADVFDDVESQLEAA